MLYNKKQLEADLELIERDEQLVSKAVAQGLINGFRAQALGEALEKKRRRCRMRLVRTQQVIAEFRGLERLRRVGAVDTLRVDVFDKDGAYDGVSFFGEEAYDAMHKQALMHARWAKGEGAADDGAAADEPYVGPSGPWVRDRRGDNWSNQPECAFEICRHGQWRPIEESSIPGNAVWIDHVKHSAGMVYQRLDDVDSPVRWVKVRYNALGFLEVFNGLSWWPLERELLKSLPNVHWLSPGDGLPPFWRQPWNSQSADVSMP